MLQKINWRYAIGEIIIVIIGITIAFALNNWAMGAKERKMRLIYLDGLITDLEAEQSHLEENIATFEANIQGINGLRPYLYGKKDGRDSIWRKIFEYTKMVHFQPNDITYKTLVNSGHFHTLNDIQLQKELEGHYSYHLLVEQDYDRQRTIHENYFGDFAVYEMDYDAIFRGDYSFMDKKNLRNILNSLYGSFQMASEISKEAIEKAAAMKVRLEAYRAEQ
ncbi:MAG: DUF6090 family protein [Bacteroidota bacterium]